MRARRNRTIIGIAALVGLAAVTLVAAAIPTEFTPTSKTEQKPSAARTVDAETGSRRHVNPLWDIPIESLTNAVERPIFSPTRRPPAKVLPPPASPAPPVIVQQPSRPSLRLVGAVAGLQEGLAIFVHEGTNSVVRLRTGETYFGWRLRSIQGREATLENGEQSAVLVILNAPPK